LHRNIKKVIDERLRFLPKNTDTYYITKHKHRFKSDNYSVRLPIYRDGKRTTRYLGRYSSIKEAVFVRDYAIDQIEKSDELSLTIPPKMSRLRKGGGA